MAGCVVSINWCATALRNRDAALKIKEFYNKKEFLILLINKVVLTTLTHGGWQEVLTKLTLPVLCVFLQEHQAR